MKKRIIKQITKALNITEEYLANYVGITHETLQKSSLQKGWEGKEKRIYRLNKVINILRNRGMKNPLEVKNLLDNERFSNDNAYDDCSYITYIVSQENIDALVNLLVTEIKIDFIKKSLGLSEPVLLDSVHSETDNLKENSTKISVFYYILKYVTKKDISKVNLDFMSKKLKSLENQSLMDFVNNKQYVFADKLDKVITEYNQEM